MWEYPELSSLVVEMRNISSLSHTDPGAREPAENKLSNTNHVPVNTNCGNTGYMLTATQHYTHTHLATTAILTVHLNTDCSLRFSLTGYQHDWGLWPRPSTFISTNEMIPAPRTDEETQEQTNIRCSSVSYLAVMLRHKWAPVGEEEIYYSSSVSRSHHWEHITETRLLGGQDRQTHTAVTVMIVKNMS